jgi:hypothetical protein
MLTPRERELLIAARTLIACGENNYICTALWTIDMRNGNHDSERLVQYVHEQLSPWTTLTSWQRNNGIVVANDEESFRENARADRLAWIDWMLDEPLLPEGCYCY